MINDHKLFSKAVVADIPPWFLLYIITCKCKEKVTLQSGGVNLTHYIAILLYRYLKPMVWKQGCVSDKWNFSTNIIVKGCVCLVGFDSKIFIFSKTFGSLQTSTFCHLRHGEVCLAYELI